MSMLQPNANSPQFGPNGNTQENGTPTESTTMNAQLPALYDDKPASTEYHIKQGYHYYKQHCLKPNTSDLNAAILHFQKAIDLDSNRIDGLIGLISVLFELGSEKLDLVRYYAEKALLIDNNCHTAHLYLGYFFQNTGYPQKSIEHFINALAKGPIINPKARFALAKALFNEQPKQETLLKRLHWGYDATVQTSIGLVTLPFDPITFRSVTGALVNDAMVYGLHWSATSLKQLGLTTHAAKIYEIGNHWMPDETIFNHLLGDQYFFDLKAPSAAIEFYQKAAKNEQNNVDLKKKLGKAYSQIHETEQAIEQFTQILSVNPKDFDANYNLGQLYIDHQAYIKALYYFKEAAAIKPRHPFVHSNMGYVLFKLEDMEGSLNQYKIALDLGTDAVWLSSVSQTIATITYKIFGDTDSALDHLQQALHYNPDNRDALATLGDIYFENDYIEMALAAYQALVKLEPENSDCHSNIGYILWQLDRNDEAIEAYLQALANHPDNSIAHNNLGVIYLDEKGNTKQALYHFEKALKLKTDYTLAAFNMGRSNEANGQTIKAAECYSKALELNAINPELEPEEIQERLDHLFK